MAPWAWLWFIAPVLATPRSGRAWVGRAALARDLALRGGADAVAGAVEEDAVAAAAAPERCVRLRVSTFTGVKALDVRCDVELPARATVRDAKRAIGAKLPGAPPRAVLRLLHGSRALRDADTLGAILDGDDDEADDAAQKRPADDAEEPEAPKKARHT